MPPAPVTERSREAAQSASRLIADEELELSWETMTEFLDGLEQTQLPLNVAELVGHGAVRAGVTGHLTPEAPADGELREMERLTKEALDAGCVGVSTGLGYPPGIFAKEPELTAFARWAAETGKLFTSHVRAYSWVSPVYQSDPEETPHNIRALQEVIRVARAARARLQLSHLIFVGRNTWPTSELAIECIEAAQDKKAEDLVVLDLRGLSDITDFFVICHGSSERQVLAITDAIEERLGRNSAVHPNHVEGRKVGEWVLMDYIDFVVHVFHPEARMFYQLENLWGDAPRWEAPEA